MTLILSMLVLIYKKSNEIDYKTAKRCISMELDDLVTIQIVIACGGNPDLVLGGLKVSNTPNYKSRLTRMNRALF